ncbi:hypothetical protein GCM10009122_28100 [Fulvivirga kasyanovii]
MYSKTKTNNEKSSEFTKIMCDENSEDYLKVNEKETLQKHVEEIITSGGSKYSLKTGERTLGYSNKKLTTYKYGQESVEIVTYNVNDQGIFEEESLSTETPHVNIMPALKAGKIILSNDSEGFGSIFRVYTTDLVGKQHYIPYPQGFSNGTSAAINNKVTFVANSLDQKKMKIAGFKDEAQLFETEITTEYRAKKVYAFEDLFVIYGSKGGADRKLIVFDWNGKLIWENAYILPYFTSIDILYDNMQHKIFAVTGIATLTILDSRSGELQSKIQLDAKTSAKGIKLSKTNLGARVIDFKIVGNSIIISLGTFIREGEFSSNYHYTNPETLILHTSGEVLQKETQKGDFKIHQIIPSKTGFNIVTDKDIQSYERK